jgi:hypothetical protein
MISNSPMKPNNLFYIASFSVLLMLDSCTKESNPVESNIYPASENVLVPLAIGNEWTFRLTIFDTTGAVAVLDTFSYFIKGDTVVEGVIWALEGEKTVGVGQIGFRNDSIGYHESNFEGWEEDLPYPGHKNESYNAWTIISTDSVVNTPLGTFWCYVYASSFFGFPYKLIYAPGVGPIHLEIVGVPTGGKPLLSETEDLISTNFKIKN